VFPTLLENDVPFHVHEVDAYWNDVGSLPEYVQGNLDAVEGVVRVELAGELLEPRDTDEGHDRGDPGVRGRVLAGEGCELDPGARLDGPLVIGAGSRVGEGALVRHCVLLPGAQVAAGSIVAGGVVGSRPGS
jgi:NDP-sugar pyrophosphorylase family protein